MIKLCHNFTALQQIKNSAYDDTQPFLFTSTQIGPVNLWSNSERFSVAANNIIRAKDEGLDFFIAIRPPDEYFQRKITNVQWEVFTANINALVSIYGKKFKGLRWNHEHRPWDIVDLRYSWKSSDFILLLDKCRDEHLNPVNGILENINVTVSVKYEFNDFVTRQCLYTSQVFTKIYNILQTFNIQFVLYPGGEEINSYSPRFFPREEYTVDINKASSYIIREVGLWDNRSTVFVDHVLNNLKGRIIITIQQSIGNKTPIDNVKMVVDKVLKNISRLEGFGFWTAGGIENTAQIEYFKLLNKRLGGGL